MRRRHFNPTTKPIGVSLEILKSAIHSIVGASSDVFLPRSGKSTSCKELVADRWILVPHRPRQHHGVGVLRLSCNRAPTGKFLLLLPGPLQKLGGLQSLGRTIRLFDNVEETLFDIGRIA
jgi:hypothetical protein